MLCCICWDHLSNTYSSGFAYPK